MNTDIDKWSSELSRFVSSALNEHRKKTAEQMAKFAVDCHPWNGTIILAFLTVSELQESPFLAEAEEMAAWKFYNFASGQTDPQVGLKMRNLYEQSGSDKAKTAGRFFEACASAIASKSVQDALSKYHLSKSFKITIPHPDTGKEYYPPT